jgi:predicted transport protein
VVPEAYDAAASMRRNLEERTGKSFAAWVHVARSLGTDKHSDIVAYLKIEGPMGHGYANQIAHAARNAETVAEENPVDVMFAGPKRDMRPIYDAIAKTVHTFGRDVEFAPKKGYMSLRRATQFALVEPSTATRIDIGIKLRDVPPAGKLEASGTWNGMVSHRVRIAKIEDFDLAVKGWLKQAYDQAG